VRAQVVAAIGRFKGGESMPPVRMQSSQRWILRGFSLSLVALIAIACQTGRHVATTGSVRADELVLNTSPPPIGNRYRMSPSDIELAILLAIGTPREVPSLKPGQPITDDVLPVVLGHGTSGPWTYAGREPGVIYADFAQSRVALHVAIMFDSDLVMLHIENSRNLGQLGDRIRQSAFTYLAPLEHRIRMNIEAVAQRNWYGTPVPANQ